MLDFLWSGSNKPPLRGGPDLPPEAPVSPDGTPADAASAAAPTGDVSDGAPTSVPSSAEPPLAEAVEPGDVPSAFGLAGRSRRRRGRRLVKPTEPRAPLTAEQRLL